MPHVRYSRTPELDHVLALVRETGESAHPRAGQTCSDLVFTVAILRDCNPVELQAQVRQWEADHTYALPVVTCDVCGTPMDGAGDESCEGCGGVSA